MFTLKFPNDVQVMREASDVGLCLNLGKCEIISSDMTTCGTLLVALPGAQLVPRAQAQMLGSPVGDDSCVSSVLSEKVEALRRLGKRLRLLPSAFLASSHSTAELVEAILPPHISALPAPHLEEAMLLWSAGHSHPAPEGAAASRQKGWELAGTTTTANRLLSEAADDAERARLLAVAAPESGAWLRALLVSALGLRMDDDTARIAVGLRLGAPTCGPHQCRHCSVEVDVFERHSLSCKKSEGRHFRHSALNDIVKRGLSAAHIPSRLEPTGLLRTDGKRPDGVTLAP